MYTKEKHVAAIQSIHRNYKYMHKQAEGRVPL